MHGYKYRYELDVIESTVKIAPTKGTLMKAYAIAFAPLVVFWGGMFVYGYALKMREAEQKLVNEAEEFLKEN